VALGFIPGAPGLEATTLVDLKIDLDKEKSAWVTTQVEADLHSHAVHPLKIFADRFASQILTLDDKVKHLEDKVVEGVKEVRAWELLGAHLSSQWWLPEGGCAA
jgi:hypothetical protein